MGYLMQANTKTLPTSADVCACVVLAGIVGGELTGYLALHLELFTERADAAQALERLTKASEKCVLVPQARNGIFTLEFRIVASMAVRMASVNHDISVSRLLVIRWENPPYCICYCFRATAWV